MTMEQIDFFLMTVRCDTFLEAAENLHIAQSTLEADPEAGIRTESHPLRPHPPPGGSDSGRRAVLPGSLRALPPVSSDAAENAPL